MPDAAQHPPRRHRDAHTPEAIRRRLRQGPNQSYLRDFIYGAIDGAVTTFAVVSGVAGAGLSNAVVIILGVANLIGDGFSMAAGNFLGVRAERQIRERLRREEEDHISVYPAGEQEEIRQIFHDKGFRDADLDRAVHVITADRERWVETMLAEEHGLSAKGPAPLRAAATTFVAFLAIGGIPLLPFVLAAEKPFGWSSALTGAAFFLVGAVKSRFVAERWWAAGLETLAAGGGAAGLAYLVGLLLGGLAAGPPL